MRCHRPYLAFALLAFFLINYVVPYYIPVPATHTMNGFLTSRSQRVQFQSSSEFLNEIHNLRKITQKVGITFNENCETDLDRHHIIWSVTIAKASYVALHFLLCIIAMVAFKIHCADWFFFTSLALLIMAQVITITTLNLDDVALQRQTYGPVYTGHGRILNKYQENTKSHSIKNPYVAIETVCDMYNNNRNATLDIMFEQYDQVQFFCTNIVCGYEGIKAIFMLLSVLSWFFGCFTLYVTRKSNPTNIN